MHSDARRGLMTPLLMLIWIGCAPSDHAATSHDTTADARAGIEATNAAFMAAYDAADAAGVAACYTEDAQLLPPNGPVIEGRAAIEEFWQAGLAPGLTGRLESLEIEGHGDTAHEVGRFTVTDAEGQVLDEGSFIVLWKKREGVWRLHRDIFNSNRPLAVADPSAEEAEE